MPASDEQDLRAGLPASPEWMAEEPSSATSAVSSILAGVGLPQIGDLDATTAASTATATAPAPARSRSSLEDILGSIDSAVARHAALVAEPLVDPTAEDPIFTKRRRSHDDVVAPPSVWDAAAPAVPDTSTTPYAPVPAHAESTPDTAESIGPAAFADTVDQVGTDDKPRSVKTEVPNAALSGRHMAIDVESGRDWDAELARSAELSPLMARNVNQSGATAAESVRSSRQTNPVADPLLDPSNTTLADLVAAATGASVEELAPVETAAAFDATTLDPVLGASAGRTDPLLWSTSSFEATPGSTPAVPVEPMLPAGAPIESQGAVVGEFIDLLQVEPVLGESDPMAVPMRPQAQPVVDPVDLKRGGAPRRKRKGKAGPAVIRTHSSRQSFEILRRAVRMVVTLACVVGLVAGGWVAVQRFVLAKRWPVTLQGVSQTIEERTGLEFAKAIPVEEVSRTEFDGHVSEARLGLSLGSATAQGSVADVMASSRALGLWSGAYDPRAAARVVARSWPAVYDPETETVYVDKSVADSDKRKAYVARELTIGLFDQEYGWPELLEGATGGESLAYRTLMESEALRVASAYAAELDNKPVGMDEAPPTMKFPEVDESSWSVVPDGLALDVRVPLVGGTALANGNVSALATLVGGDEELLYSTNAGTDEPPLGRLLDSDTLARGIGPQGSQGVSFWMTVLLERLEVDQVTSSLQAYRGDNTRTVLSDTDGDGTSDRVCVELRLKGSNEATTNTLQSVVQQWASLAPAESATSVSRPAKNVVGIRACDPGVQAQTATRSTAVFDSLWFTASRGS